MEVPPVRTVMAPNQYSLSDLQGATNVDPRRQSTYVPS